MRAPTPLLPVENYYVVEGAEAKLRFAPPQRSPFSTVRSSESEQVLCTAGGGLLIRTATPSRCSSTGLL
jgi:hypothetical protein